jgi:branched-chain amino acid transport system permease protein
LLTVLPEKLRFIGDYRMLGYAIVLIVVMVFSNNPQVRLFIDSLREKLLKRGGTNVPADASEGGDAS